MSLNDIIACVFLATASVGTAACGSKQPPPDEHAGGGSGSSDGSGDGSDTEPACVKGGCSGTVCAEEGNDMMTTCEFKPEYACYQTATCERQDDGACGWTQTSELTDCLGAGGPAGE
jgi:hypothetical protein